MWHRRSPCARAIWADWVKDVKCIPNESTRWLAEWQFRYAWAGNGCRSRPLLSTSRDRQGVCGWKSCFVAETVETIALSALLLDLDPFRVLISNSRSMNRERERVESLLVYSHGLFDPPVYLSVARPTLFPFSVFSSIFLLSQAWLAEDCIINRNNNDYWLNGDNIIMKSIM